VLAFTAHLPEVRGYDILETQADVAELVDAL